MIDNTQFAVTGVALLIYAREKNLLEKGKT